MCSGRCCSSCLPFPLAGRLAAWAAPAPGRPTSSGCPGRLLCAWAGTRRPPTSLMRQVVWRVLAPQAAWRRERHCRGGTGRGEVAGRADRAGRPSAMVRPSMRPKLAPVAVVVRFVGSVPRRGWLRYESTWPSECGCPPGRPDRRPSSRRQRPLSAHTAKGWPKGRSDCPKVQTGTARRMLRHVCQA